MEDGQVRWVGQQAVIATPAEIDVTNTDQVRQILLAAASLSPAVLIIDMSTTTFCDSAGVQAIIATYQQTTATRTQLRLVATTGVLRILTIIGTGQLIPIYPTLEAALAEATVHPGGAASPGRSGRQAGERERRLEEREHQIAEREHEADEREHEADEREHEADEREREADEREERLQERAARLRQHAVELRARGTGVREQAEQAVARAQAVLQASQGRMRRAEAALEREHARAGRQRANVARSVRQDGQRPVPPPPDFTELAARVSALRKRTAAAAARLAETEEQVARILDELAARDPGNPQHMRLADEAREAARRARETEQKYNRP